MSPHLELGLEPSQEGGSPAQPRPLVPRTGGGCQEAERPQVSAWKTGGRVQALSSQTNTLSTEELGEKIGLYFGGLK